MIDENNENINHSNEPEIKIEAISENEDENNLDEESFLEKIKKEHKKWGNLQKVRCLLFVIKEKLETNCSNKHGERDYYKKMAECINYSNYQYCRRFHRSLFKKYETVDNLMYHLYFDQEMLNAENKRINAILKNYHENEIKRISKLTKYEIENNIKSIDVDETIEAYEVKEYKDKYLEYIGELKNFENLTLESSSNVEKNIHFSMEMLIVIEKENPVKREFSKIEEKELNKIIKNFKNENKKRNKMKKKNEMKKRIIKIRKLKYKRFKNEKMEKENSLSESESFDTEIEKTNKKGYKFKKIKKESKELRRVYWTRPEKIKFIIFLMINKEHLNISNLSINSEILIKCSEYINTEKTPKNCKHRIYNLLKKNNMNLTETIKKEMEELKMTEELFEKERLNYSYNNDRKMKCKIKIEDLIPSKSNAVSEENVCSINNKIYELEYSIEFFETNNVENESEVSLSCPIEEQSNEFSEDNELSNKSDENTIMIEPLKPVKKILKIKVSERIFSKFIKSITENNFAENLIYLSHGEVDSYETIVIGKKHHEIIKIKI